MEKQPATSLPASSGGSRSIPYFLSRRVWPYALVSILALIPCVWLPRIEAGDLASHTYNAWLVSLVQQGKAPGLWVAKQTNNILFDLLLLHLGTSAGFLPGERIAVCLAVLVFLWGAFAWLWAVAGKPAWFLAPLLIMLSYGWTFHAGFFNFYLSLGFSFAALAVVWRARGVRCLWVIPFLPLIWMAHPLGFFFFASIVVYLLIARLMDERFHWLLAAAVILSLLVFRVYLARHYQVRFWHGPYYPLLGLDQMLLGQRYWLLSPALAIAILLGAVFHARQTANQPASILRPSVLVQLYVLGFLALALLPDEIALLPYASPVDLICSRFTLAVAILGCCILSRLRPQLLFAVLSGGVALAYFGLVYQDAVKTYAMEKQADILVTHLPRDARLIATIYPFRGFRIFVHHVADRACLGHCFTVDNYEPATGQFRLRAAPASPLAANWEDGNHMMIGDYVVRPEDLPLWQMFQCGPSDVDLCLRPLHVGSLRNLP